MFVLASAFDIMKKRVSLAFVEKTFSKNINEKAKSKIKLVFDYSLYLDSRMYICNIVLGVMGTLKGNGLFPYLK